MRFLTFPVFSLFEEDFSITNTLSNDFALVNMWGKFLTGDNDFFERFFIFSVALEYRSAGGVMLFFALTVDVGAIGGGALGCALLGCALGCAPLGQSRAPCRAWARANTWLHSRASTSYQFQLFPHNWLIHN